MPSNEEKIAIINKKLAEAPDTNAYHFKMTLGVDHRTLNLWQDQGLIPRMKKVSPKSRKIPWSVPR